MGEHPGVGAVRTDALAFGEFRLDRANALLWRGGEGIALAPKPFEVFCFLVGGPGERGTKEGLLAAGWSDLHVSKSSLAVAVNALRSVLGDDRQSPNYIETVTRRGYRFIAAVATAELPAIERAPEEEAASVTEQAADRRRHWRVG